MNPQPGKKRKLLRWTAVILFLLLVTMLVFRYISLTMFEKKGLPVTTTSHNVPAVPYTRLHIPSGPRTLDAFWVPAADSNAPAVLIFHGIRETIPMWIQAQQLLHEQGISTLVFDYSGAGNSTGPATVAHLNEDGLAAWTVFRQYAKDNPRTFILGFSMGSGMAMHTAVNIPDTPRGVILCEPLSSLRGAAAASGTPKIFVYSLPDAWNNIHNAASLKSPLLIVHSDADSTFPLSMSQAIGQHATNVAHQLRELHGFTHNALYTQPGLAYWTPIINFIHGQP